MNWVIQPPGFVRNMFHGSLWRLPEGQKRVCLTFDDGPVPEQTPWVIDTLAKHGIRATFFCVGDNIRKHPQLFRQLAESPHVIGNHTFNHVKLLSVTWREYLRQAQQCSDIANGSQYFRPPHGQMLPWRMSQLLNAGFRRIVFWDVMPKDYDRRLSPEAVFDNVRQYVRDGSIIVFHDSVKAGERMRYALVHTIDYLQDRGYTFCTIDEYDKTLTET